MARKHPVRGAVRALVVAGLVGCGGRGNGEMGLAEGGASSGHFTSEDASGVGPLDASIEEDHVQVTLVTLGCAGACATVEAVATGGNPPYSFAWEDGSTSARRQVCPTVDTRYTVRASDTAVTGEFPRPAETVERPLTADVLACPDAGGAEGGARDCTTILVVNPPSATVTGTNAVSCSSGSSSAASSVAFSAAAALAMGQEYEIEEDVTGMLLLGSAPVWNLYGATAACGAAPEGQLLGSMTFDPGTPHQSSCFTANANYTAIDWSTSSVAAGYGQGTYRLCAGCSHTSP